MQRHDLRNALLCAAAVTAAFFLVNPFVNMPFDDDWCYSFTVRQFLDTGHIVYSGWSAPLLISQTWWAAIFCKLFGYSFITLRFSTLPFAIGCAIFSYLLARATDLRPAAAICFSLTLCLSPLFLPLAASYMTDVPALCYTLISIYSLMRAGQSATTRHALIWLVVGFLAGIIGGMTRQPVWAVPFFVIPYLVVLRRSNRVFVVAGIFVWLLALLDIVLCLQWFSRQPNVFIDPSLFECLRIGFGWPHIWITDIIMVVFTTIMFALPVLLPFTFDSLKDIWRNRKSWRSAVTAIVVVGLAAGMSYHPGFGMGPWLYNIVTTKGVIGPLELSGNRPTVLPLLARGVISALVLTTTYLLVARLIVFIVEFRRTLIRLRNFFSTPSGDAILMIFTVTYALFMMVRAAQDLVFDRYCLPLIPGLAIPLLRRRSLYLVWPLLVIFIGYAIASTQDNLALAAARRAAIDRLESHGVARTQIAAGFEYDFYTQLEERGHINRFGMTNPTRPFDGNAGYTPALKCKYRIEFPLGAGMEPSPFGSIDYISWLPPFRRKVYIDQFKNPWWLDPEKSMGKIPPMNYEVDYEN